jgi:eukaryotic-like serine/threonine-protein kinase
MSAERVLGGRYRLVERLGQGGMSVVWRGYDEVLGRPVAVKVLTARYAAHVPSAYRIRTEAQAAARLSHPHVTGVHDYGESVTEAGERVPYVVMELLSGRTMADRLKQDGPLPVPVALLACAQVASALAAAHACGLVHRDIKPSNVMLTPAGVKVLDFGLAADTGTTVDGDLIGTPAYLAPERLTTGEAEPASDVYGLGLLLFAALTGRLPWRAETAAEMLAAHQYAMPARLPATAALPRGVRTLYEGCLAKDPRQRPTAHQVAAGLAEATLRRRHGRPWAALAAVGSGPVVDGVIEAPVVRAVVPVAAAAAEFHAMPTEETEPTDAVLIDGTVDVVLVDSGAGAEVSSANRWGAAAVMGAAAVVIAALVGGFLAPGGEPILPGIPAPGPGIAAAAAPAEPASTPMPAATGETIPPPALPVTNHDAVRETGEEDSGGRGGDAPTRGGDTPDSKPDPGSSSAPVEPEPSQPDPPTSPEPSPTTDPVPTTDPTPIDPDPDPATDPATEPPLDTSPQADPQEDKTQETDQPAEETPLSGAASPDPPPS